MKKNEELFDDLLHRPELIVFFQTLQGIHGLVIRDKKIWIQALTHKSFYYEFSDRVLGHNEVLEFLGDRALDLILAEQLFRQFPDVNEGVLSKLKASLVSEQPLSEIARQLQLGQFLLLGEGEIRSKGQTKPRLLASAVEALVGAAYLDLGFEETQKWVLALFDRALKDISPDTPFAEDYKTRLQERTQAQCRQTPTYSLIQAEGPDHQKVFEVEVSLQGRFLAKGVGRSKKLAEQAAAKNALEGKES